MVEFCHRDDGSRGQKDKRKLVLLVGKKRYGRTIFFLALSIKKGAPLGIPLLMYRIGGGGVNHTEIFFETRTYKKKKKILRMVVLLMQVPHFSFSLRKEACPCERKKRKNKFNILCCYHKSRYIMKKTCLFPKRPTVKMETLAPPLLFAQKPNGFTTHFFSKPPHFFSKSPHFFSKSSWILVKD